MDRYIVDRHRDLFYPILVYLAVRQQENQFDDSKPFTVCSTSGACCVNHAQFSTDTRGPVQYRKSAHVGWFFCCIGGMENEKCHLYYSERTVLFMDIFFALNFLTISKIS